MLQQENSIEDNQKVYELYAALKRNRPRTRTDLYNYIKVFAGVDIPEKKICLEHDSPMDYVWHGFNMDFQEKKSVNADLIVWANRGGGKTQQAAILTLLDCLFKPGCQVRILGGSSEQSQRMYDYLIGYLNKGFSDFLSQPALKGKCKFSNGSAVEVLAQSATSVRGQHVHKLRCDEVELFTKDVLSATKFTTQSTLGITAGMEMISTMHRPYGLMQQEVATARKMGTKIFKWCIWEVIERCAGRICSQCLLWGDCHGKAKQAQGYLKIDDCITQMQRSSRAGWESEMLCKRPNLDNVVFDEFDADIHICQIDYNSDLPLFRTLDFGFVNPFVCLWIQVDEDGVVRVIDEYVRSRATIDVHAEQIKKRTACNESQVAGTYCDPAGVSRNDVTGTSAVKELRSHGIETRYRKSSILEGIEAIRRHIKSGDGISRLIISPRCKNLLEAIQCYHYPERQMSSRRSDELPLKDGVYDHPIDALRYFFVNFKYSDMKALRGY